jgi:hypothetical protein
MTGITGLDSDLIRFPILFSVLLQRRCVSADSPPRAVIDRRYSGARLSEPQTMSAFLPFALALSKTFL